MLTLNVERLPLLMLEQWQIIFSIIALGASSGSFAAIKSFEVRIIVSAYVLILECLRPMHGYYVVGNGLATA